MIKILLVLIFAVQLQIVQFCHHLHVDRFVNLIIWSDLVRFGDTRCGLFVSHHLFVRFTLNSFTYGVETVSKTVSKIPKLSVPKAILF